MNLFSRRSMLPMPVAGNGLESASGLDAASVRAQQHYLEGGAKDDGWWQALDGQLELLSRAAMRSSVEAL